MWLKHARLFVDLLAGGPLEASQPCWTDPKDVSFHGKTIFRRIRRDSRSLIGIANCLTTDIMGTIVFGRELDLQLSSSNRYIVNVISRLQKWNSAYIQSPSLASLKLDKLFYPQQLYYGWKLLGQVRKFVEGRSFDDNEAKNDIFSYLVDAKAPNGEQSLSTMELRSNAKLLMVACK